MGSAARTFSANHPEAQEQPLPRLATMPMIALCSAKFLFHVLTSIQHYGYFRDELYYLDMARHLDWGYVDAAPLIAVYAKLSLLLGGSLAALRLLPALAGTALIALTMLIARELGGNRYAQTVTGLVVLFSPGVLWADSLLTMNAFEPLYWMGCIWVIVRILRTGEPRCSLGEMLIQDPFSIRTDRGFRPVSFFKAFQDCLRGFLSRRLPEYSPFSIPVGDEDDCLAVGRPAHRPFPSITQREPPRSKVIGLS
jgi:hypothetical protein